MSNKLNFHINIKSLDPQIENIIYEKINTNPPESYAQISSCELDKIYNIIINKFPKNKTEYFSKQIISSIRTNIMRNYMIQSHHKIINNKNKIINDYNNKINIKSLTIKYDISPLNLLRIIFKKIYNKKLTFIIKNISMLTPYDKNQLEWAINNDFYALINQNEILIKSNKFELNIKKILDKHDIKYKTQNELSDEQIKKSGIALITPDFLILSDFYINGKKINWIDAKNFFGSNIQYIVQKIKSQTKKYINKWGYGSIIFNLGFSSKLKFNNILLIDYESFKNLDN